MKIWSALRKKIVTLKKKYLGQKTRHKLTVEILLPLEIIEFEILPRLPAKSLGRCMCVSKQWKSIISSREFTRMNLQYVSKSQTNHKLLEIDTLLGTFTTRDCEALNKTGSVTNRSIPFEGDFLILGSLEGLVCVILKETCDFVLWNPLTGSYKKLSNFNSPRFERLSYGKGFGFYYDPCNNDYKLLSLVSNGALGAYIYSLRSDSWRKIQCLEENHPCHSNDSCWLSGTFLGENLYFAVGDMGIRGFYRIIVFNVKSEKFREIQYPHVPSDVGNFLWSIVVVKGFIHLCISYLKRQTDFKHSGELWRLMDGDGWKKVMTFSRKDRGYPLHCDNAYVTRNGNSLVILENNSIFYKIDIEDLAANWLVNFCVLWWWPDRKTIYLETLVSPSC